MANLNDLPVKSIMLMDREELISHILKIRNARRSNTKIPKATTPKTQQKSSTKLGSSIISSLSPEQALRILAAIGEMKEDESEDDKDEK